MIISLQWVEYLELIFVDISTSLGSLDVSLDLSLDYHIY